MVHIYDTVIIGGGPAGLSAGLYASRSKMDTLLIERAKYGGQATTTEDIDNYPGSMDECTGSTITERMRCQAEKFGTNFTKDDVIDINISENIKTVICKRAKYQGKTVIIGTGAYPKMCGFKNELELRGKGISYCAVCDADFFTELNVAVVGGGDSALTEALYLTKFADSVTVIHRRDQFRGVKYLQEKILNNPKISVIYDSVVTEAKGDEILEGLNLKNVKTGEESFLQVEGCFVFVGYMPISKIFEGIVTMDEKGYIITDQDMRTNVKGVFAAGDVRRKSLRQVITAAADGAVAATAAEAYIQENE